MQRRSFLSFTLSSAPLLGLAPFLPDDRVKKGVFVASGKDRFNEVPGSVKVSGKDTNGDLCIFEGYSSPTQKKGWGPLLHLHHQQDEWFHIIEGEFLFQVGEEKFGLKAGDSLLAPRGIPHAFVKLTDDRSRMMTVYQPAGTMEAYFQAIRKFTGRPTDDDLTKLFLAHGMEVVGPRLTPE
ncbi:MAG TPA: cupin domain-containing protein [Spirosoma sp.]|nr:cupin domain-containing protein [Spirosoma sp.]